MPKLLVAQLYDRMKDALQLDLLGNPAGLEREITSIDASGPGLVLAGYVGRFVHARVQVFGETEVSYLNSLDAATRARNLKQFFSFPIPCVMITKGQTLPDGMEAEATGAGVAILRSKLKTQEFYRHIGPFLESAFGVGLLLTGSSGIGKSECVLDLVERGHRLVADDLVICRRRGTDVVIGRAHEHAHHHMEIRGVGLVDVPKIFGIRAVRQQKRIEVCVHLEHWEAMQGDVERTGLDAETTRVLDVELPLVTVPLNPGKNITVIAEVIAMNHLLKYSGVNVAEAFNERLKARMRQSTANVGRYLQDDDE
jgi:HPr kinase/phosphorylase